MLILINLYEEIGNILGTDRENSVVILGAGNLGKAIANYTNFKKRGFSIKAIFDNNDLISFSASDSNSLQCTSV